MSLRPNKADDDLQEAHSDGLPCDGPEKRPPMKRTVELMRKALTSLLGAHRGDC